MKKLLVTSLGMLVGVSVFAQGTVNWASISPAAFTMQTNSTTYSSLYGGGSTGGGAVGATALAANGFYGELLYTAYSGSQVAQPTSLAALSAWSDAGLGGVNGTATTGKMTPLGASTQAVVPWSNGTTQSVMFVAWSSNLGTTWSSALSTLNSQSLLGNVVGNAFFGMSTTGYINPASGNPGNAVFGVSPTTFGLPISSLNTQLYLVPVPEPGTMALAALGGASLLLFRRRK
jgi:hypothetical protein